MSNRLGGKQGTAYLGTNANQPPNCSFQIRNPTTTDINYSLLDLWLNQTNQSVWVLVSLAGNSTSKGAVATWQMLGTGGGTGSVNGISDNFGTVTSPDGAGIIQFIDGINTNSLSVGGNMFLVDLNDFIQWPATSAAGDAGLIIIDGQIVFQFYGTNNTFLGASAGNLNLTTVSAVENTGLGAASLVALISSPSNTAVGFNSLNALESGAGLNTAIGRNSGLSLVNGENNILIGQDAGVNYTSNESNNIIIGNDGVIGDGNTMRLGTDGVGAGEVNVAFMAGVYNRLFGATSGVVQIDNTFKLGSSNGANGQVLIGGGTGPVWANLTSSGATIAISNGPNTINLEAVGGGSPTIQVAFLAQNTPNIPNATGGGTLVEYGATQALTEIFDVGNNLFVGDGVGAPAVFTAPVTAKYYLEITVDLNNLDVSLSNEGIASIVTTARTYTWLFNPALCGNAGNNNVIISFSQVVDMAANDTATFSITADGTAGATDQAGFGDGAYIAGFLISGAGMGTVGLVTDSGTATENNGLINVLGGNNIMTTATAVDTVTIDLNGTTNHAIQVGNATGSLTSLAVATNGQIPIGSTGADPILATLTAGTNVTINNAPGSITINATGGGGGGTTWNLVPGTTQAMVANNGYVTANGALTTLTLPVTAAFGTILEISGLGNGGWAIAQNAGQQINFLTDSTTIGVGGSITAIEDTAAIKMVCAQADTIWNVISSEGNFTIV